MANKVANKVENKVENKRLVIDANIFIRAIFGVRVRTLLEQYCETTAFYIAEANLEEALFYTESLGIQRGLDESVRQAAIDSLMTMIQVIPDDDLQATRERATLRIAQRDPDDWPAVAAALVLDCPVWTEDADFFGTTQTVEIYLLGVH